MAYVLGGVLVERSQQSMRPREPRPPGRTLTVSSRMMSTRMLRPRENNAINGFGGLGIIATTKGEVQHVTAKVAADRYLTLIKKHRGQQRYLEDTLKQIGADMRAVQNKIRATSVRQNTRQSRSMGAVDASADSVGILQAQLLQLQADADACINAIKACAVQANAAAVAATENGATPTEVQNANTSAGTSSGSANISTPPTTSTDIITADNASKDTVVETNAPTVLPDGTVVAPDAKLVDIPASGASSPPVASSGGLLTFGNVLTCFGLYFGYRWLKKHTA